MKGKYTSEEREELPFIRATELKAGDVFIRPKGHSPIECLSARVTPCGRFVRIEYRYVNSRKYIGNIPMSSSMKYTNETMVRIVNSKGTENMTKLYQTTKESTPRFGTLLAFNSAGQAVLEMKGSGEVLTFEPKDIEVVRPYTVDVRFAGDTMNYSYLSKPGAVKVGDVVLMDSGAKMVFVKAIDTKSDKATKVLRGRRLVTEDVDAPADQGDEL